MESTAQPYDIRSSIKSELDRYLLEPEEFDEARKGTLLRAVLAVGVLELLPPDRSAAVAVLLEDEGPQLTAPWEQELRLALLDRFRGELYAEQQKLFRSATTTDTADPAWSTGEKGVRFSLGSARPDRLTVYLESDTLDVTALHFDIAVGDTLVECGVPVIGPTARAGHLDIALDRAGILLGSFTKIVLRGVGESLTLRLDSFIDDGAAEACLTAE